MLYNLVMIIVHAILTLESHYCCLPKVGLSLWGKNFCWRCV